MQDKDPLSVVAIEQAAGWLNNLAVTGSFELLRATATFWMVNQLLDVTDDALDQLCRGIWILDGDVVGDSVQIT